MHILAIILAILMLPLPAFADETERSWREIGQEVEKLKEEVLQQKIALRQVEEAVLFGKIADTRASITFKNEAEDYFDLIEAEFFLDGKPLAKTTEAGSTKLLTILDGEIPPGEHEIKLRAVYVIGKKGPITYGNEYRFTVESLRNFNIDPGKSRAIQISINDRGFFKTELKERLAVTFHMTAGL